MVGFLCGTFSHVRYCCCDAPSNNRELKNSTSPAERGAKKKDMSILPNPPFATCDIAQLTSFVVALNSCTRARSTEQLALTLASEVAASSSILQPPAQRSLCETYGEVRLLRDMLLARIAMRDLVAATELRHSERNNNQNSKDALMMMMWRNVSTSFAVVAESLPDPVFIHIAKLAEMVRIPSNAISSSPPTLDSDAERMRLLGEASEVLLRVQGEVLQNSKSLQERCLHITIHFHQAFPFCVTH